MEKFGANKIIKEQIIYSNLKIRKGLNNDKNFKINN